LHSCNNSIILEFGDLTVSTAVQYENHVGVYINNSGWNLVIFLEIDHLRSAVDKKDSQCIEILTQIVATQLHMQNPSFAVTWQQLKSTFNSQATIKQK
jgi:hypothetical protein